jgi:hypothetical protein
VVEAGRKGLKAFERRFLSSASSVGHSDLNLVGANLLSHKSNQKRGKILEPVTVRRAPLPFRHPGTVLAPYSDVQQVQKGEAALWQSQIAAKSPSYTVITLVARDGSRAKSS